MWKFAAFSWKAWRFHDSLEMPWLMVNRIMTHIIWTFCLKCNCTQFDVGSSYIKIYKLINWLSKLARRWSHRSWPVRNQPTWGSCPGQGGRSGAWCRGGRFGGCGFLFEKFGLVQLLPVEEVDATEELPHEVFDPFWSQTRYRASLKVHSQVLNQVSGISQQDFLHTLPIITWSMCSKTR